MIAYDNREQMKLDLAAYVDDPDAAERSIIARWGKSGTMRNQGLGVDTAPPQMPNCDPQTSVHQAGMGAPPSNAPMPRAIHLPIHSD